MATHKEVTTDLERLLKALQAMTPLPPSDKDMNDAEHEAWMDKHYLIESMIREAKDTAVQGLPPEIRQLLRSVEQAAYRLYSDSSERTQP